MAQQTRAANEQLIRIEQRLKAVDALDTLRQTIVDAPFFDKLLTTTYDLGIIVLLSVDDSGEFINRVALSDTEHAKGSTTVSAVPFSEIRIPIDDPNNCIANVIKTGNHQLIDDWYCLFTPALTAEEARRNQAGAGIDCSLVWPLKSGKGGALIFSFYQPQDFIGDQHIIFAKQYAELVDTLLNELK